MIVQIKKKMYENDQWVAAATYFSVTLLLYNFGTLIKEFKRHIQCDIVGSPSALSPKTF